MKPKGDVPNTDPKVWCAWCSIRLARNEERTVIEGKTYHTRCYSKLHSPNSKSFELRSSAFQQNLSIPTKYTCDGANVSVPLSWRDAPKEANSFALIVDDPDAPAGIWVHWLIYDLPAGSHALGEGIPNQETLGNGAKQGVNDFGKVGYTGPCPPRGAAHRYFFKLYALDPMTELEPLATKQQLLDAMNKHILAEAELVGTYRRGLQF